MSEKSSRSIEFAFVGCASILVQVVFLRQLIGLFGGSEIIYALILTLWLTETGFWSLFADRFRLKLEKALRSKLSLLYSLLTATLPCYLIIPSAKVLLFSDFGPVSLSHIAVFSFFCLILPTAFPGAAFAIIVHFRKLRESGASVGHAYLFDSLGFALGGVMLTILLSVSGLDWVLLLLLSSVSAARFSAIRFGRGISIPATVACSLVALMSVFLLGESAMTWYRDSSAGRGCPDSYYYRTDETATSVTRAALSPHGHIRAVSDGVALSIYYNSQRISTFPYPPVQELIAVPLAMCRGARSMCIIGNACDGKAVFAAHDTALSVVQVEPDPVLCNLFHEILSDCRGLTDAADRIRLVHADPVRFLRGSVERFDVIYINYSHISGVAEGVYFTREFLEMVRSRLSPGGVTAFSTHCGENFIQPERLEYIRNLLVTLGSIFPEVRILPGEEAIIIGGMEKSRLTSDPYEILAALPAYRDHLAYFGEAYLPDRFSEFRREKLDRLLALAAGEELTVSKPRQHLLNAILEMDKFSGIDSRILRRLRHLPVFVTVAAAVSPIVLLLIIGFARRGEMSLLIPAFFAGWWGLSFAILLMVLYQSIAGNLYSRLGLLAGLSMLGVAVGAWAGRRAAGRRTDIGRLIGHVLMGGVLTALVAGLTAPGLLSDFSRSSAGELAIFALAVVSGMISGTVFNLSAARYAQLRDRESPGRFYGADLFGAAAGGSITTVIVLPLVGIHTGFLIFSLAALITGMYSYRT